MPCAQWARSWHVGKAAKEETAGIVARTIYTSPGQPGTSISGFSARSITHVQADQNAELVSILRTRSAVEQPRSQPERFEVRTINAQIGTQPATINVQLDGQIGSLSRACRGAKKKGWKGK